MNDDLIKEFARQAGEHVNSVYTPLVRSKTPEKIWEDGHVDWHTQFNQKFAELIVKECVEVVDQWKKEPFPLDADVLSREIRLHFGVK
jgi:hypothetical protein